MKKFTKILIAAGIIGAAKYVYDHYEIGFKKEVEEENRDVVKPSVDQNVVHNIHTSTCDHVYYDNRYNICKIYLDENGCPYILEFENADDCDHAFLDICYECISPFDGKDCGANLTLEHIFSLFGLVIDDYKEFKDRSVYWTAENFKDLQKENALPRVMRLW